MIILTKKNGLESIFTTTNKDIVISLNTDGLYGFPSSGYNDLSSQFYVKDAVASLAGFIARCNCNIAQELINIGRKKLGTIIKITENENTFWGIVCYELNDQNKIQSPFFIKNCLDEISKEIKNPVSYLIGKEIINKDNDNRNLILKAIQESDLEVVVYV